MKVRSLSYFPAIIVIICLSTTTSLAQSRITEKINIQSCCPKFEKKTGVTTYSVRLQNKSREILDGPFMVVVEAISNSDVSLQNSDGVFEEKPYILYPEKQLKKNRFTARMAWKFKHRRGVNTVVKFENISQRSDAKACKNCGKQATVYVSFYAMSGANRPPIANAGNDLTVKVQDEVQLDGSGSADPDGDELSYKWSMSKTPDNSTAQLNDAVSVRPSFTADKAGSYEVMLIVNDGWQDSEPDTCEVSTENSSPVANAGEDQTVFVGNTVTLDGSGSTDVDGDQLSYQWSFLSTPDESAAELFDSDTFKPFFQVDLSGSYVVNLTVNDVNGENDSDSVTITTENSVPVADAGTDQTVFVGETVTLDGSGSKDADNDPLTYAWSFVTKPSASAAALSNPAMVNPVFEVDVPGTYVVQLTVDDGNGESHSDSVTITTENSRPVADAGEDQAVFVGETVTLDGSGSTDVDGDSLAYLWSFTNVPDGSQTDLVNADQTIASFIPDLSGDYLVQLVVSDGLLSSDPPDTTQIKVTVAPVQKPVIETFSADPQTVNAGESSTLSWTIAHGTSASIDNGIGNVDALTGSFMVTPAVTTTYTLTAVNSDGVETAKATVNVNSEFPPDPGNVATSVDPTVATILNTATKFLYTGENPVQTGVNPEDINPQQTAVLRGKVMTRDGDPLSGVTLTILDHEEFGQTISRADGMFDLVVNGGGYLTVEYKKNGYLPAQRTIYVPWHDYTRVGEVILIPLDSTVNAVNLESHESQWAEGSQVTDEDGSRKASLLILPNNRADLVFPDGSTQPVSNLNVRITEYSVGSSGPKSMPAHLPPTSAYTYCFEVSADEALNAGAGHVAFDQPILFYVENFLGFPTGTPIPLGYYDRVKAAWMPENDGLVISIVGTTNGLADLDIDGDNSADDAGQLEALGIFDAERKEIAERYGAGKTLWRLTIKHFSSYDPNYGIVPEDGAEEPKLPTPGGGSDEKPDFDCFTFGSFIECSNQILSEQMNLTGTPYTLNYASDRVPDNQANFILDIPLSGSSVPSVLKRIDLHIQVAGQSHQFSYAPAAHLNHNFQWDGKDIYGRLVYGLQPVQVKIDYIYDGWYALPPSMGESFGFPSGKPVPGNIPAREGAVLSQSHIKTLGISPSQEDLGGWSLGAHHHYDPLGRILYLGTGSRRSANNINTRVMNRAAGTDVGGFSGDGGPATEAQLYGPHDVTAAADGGYYIADLGNQRIRYVSPVGKISTIAGNGTKGTSGDDGSATEAELSGPADLALGPDGSLYIAFYYDESWPEDSDPRIRRVKNGIITTVAGNGTAGFSGDGGPAIEAQLNGPAAVAVTEDGTLYIADQGNHCIRRIAPDGIISTFAGTPGISDYSGDGGPATEAMMGSPSDVAIGPDGSLYVFELGNNVVRKISPSGIITTVLNLDEAGYVSLDPAGLMASTVQSDSFANSIANTLGKFLKIPSAHAISFLRFPKHLAVAPDGTLFVSTFVSILQIGTAGDIVVIAGGGTDQTPDEGGPATQANFARIEGIAAAPDGTIYFCHANGPSFSSVRRLSSLMPGFTASDIAIPSSSGQHLYRFSPAGRHLQTLYSLTGGVLSEFEYDQAGRLAKVEDGSGNITIIERDESGKAIAILSPHGQRTTVGLDSNGYLSSITNPAGEATQFSYSSGGLLEKRIDPKEFEYKYYYNSTGRLDKEENPVNGYQALERADLNGGHEVTKTTALNLTSKFRVEWLDDGKLVRTNTLTDGTQTIRETATDGKDITRTPDGVEIASKEGPDPRFGMQAPIIAERTVSTPGGLTQTITNQRSAVLGVPGDPSSIVTLEEVYSKNGRDYIQVYNSATRTFTETSPEGRTTIKKIDELGRLLNSQYGNLAPTIYTYDNKGRISSVTSGTGSEARTLTYNYNTQGFLASREDPLGRITSFQYDLIGRRISQTMPGNLNVTFGYDANSNLTSVTPPGKTAHQFAFSSTNLLQQYIPPALNTIADTAITHEYNLDQQLIGSNYPGGLRLDLEYDNAGRVIKRTLPGGNTLSYSYFPFTGQLQSIVGSNGISLSFTYDGDLITGNIWAGAVEGSVNRYFDNNFRIINLKVNGGNEISCQYDQDGLLIRAGDISFTRDSQTGLIHAAQLNNIADSRQYNEFGEMVNYRLQYSGTDPWYIQYLYEYDKLGRIVEKTETSDDHNNSTAWQYSYDPAGRLTEVKKDTIEVASYSYDQNGNRLSFTSAGVTVSGNYDNQDRLLQYGENTYNYTDDGRLLSMTNGSGGTTYYTYDLLGNLIHVTLADGTNINYLIDGQSRRIGKKIDGSLVQGFLYLDSINPVAELDQNNQVKAVFVYGSRQSVPDYMIKDGVTYRVIADQVGSVRMVVDTTTGQVAQRIDYDAFGRVEFDSNPGFQPFGFAGGLYDYDTGLIRFGARDYDPETGRWTTKDRALFSGGQTNLYAYINNSPVGNIDPTGMESSEDSWDTWLEEKKKEAWQIYNWIFTDSAPAPLSKEDLKNSFARNNPLDRDIDLDVSQTDSELQTSTDFLNWAFGEPYLDVINLQIDLSNHDHEPYVNGFINYFSTNYRSQTITHKQLESLIDNYAKHLAPEDKAEQEKIKNALKFCY